MLISIAELEYSGLLKEEVKMGMFKSSKSDLAAGPDVPIDQVVAMKSQGYSNNQIIQTLQRDGYTSSQIFDAISQSEMSGIGAQQDIPSMQNMPSMNQQPMNSQSMNQINSGMQAMGMPGMNNMNPMVSGMGSRGSSNEELIEAIIDEKWNELVKDINKVIEWKQKADQKLVLMEQKMTDIKEQFDKLHQAIIGKIGDYDKNMLNVATEIQAMEKVFSKVLPTFMDNVNELTRITDNLKSSDKNSDRSSSQSNSDQSKNIDQLVSKKR